MRSREGLTWAQRAKCVQRGHIHHYSPVQYLVAIISNTTVLIFVCDPNFHGYAATATRELSSRFGQLPFHIHIVVVHCTVRAQSNHHGGASAQSYQLRAAKAQSYQLRAAEAQSYQHRGTFMPNACSAQQSRSGGAGTLYVHLYEFCYIYIYIYICMYV
jgi:hypothetical protein